MILGSVIAGRFEIESFAGAGGMSQVYRALDRLSGAHVALKILRDPAAHASRFRREAELLSALDHRGIVRYVAYAAATGDTPAFMAMEWLEGESLRERLARGPLGIGESVSLVHDAAVALGCAHAAGVVHRDVKPENLFLVGGRTDRVKVLDFGVAFARDVSRRMTVTGIPMGTVGYMSPEQVRAEGSVDARADVFALGAVLFECLTGVPAFAADHPLAVLAKIVCEPAPSAREHRPAVPVELDRLLASMLEKEPDHRPADGAKVAEALAGFAGFPATPDVPARRTSVALGPAERHVVTAVIGTSTERCGSETLPMETFRSRDRVLEELAQRFGGRYEALASAGFVVLFSGRAAASDSALRAARCALALEATKVDAEICIVTGSAVTSNRLPVAQAVDRGVDLIREAPRRGIWLDAATAGLLPARFEVEHDGPRIRLVRENRREAASLRPVPEGQPCLGRERELETLAAVLDECASEPVARVVLLTGAVGVGKSRIAREACRLAEHASTPFEVWSGRGDPLTAGAPFSLIADVLANAMNLGEDALAARAELEARVARHVPGPQARHVAEFLGELVGLSFPDEDRVQLRAARGDPSLMRDQVRRAFFDLLEHECRAHPLLIVLEDLHWGDQPSLDLIDAFLRRAPELPLLVLGVARPELFDSFPNAFAERARQEIRVRELPRATATAWARAALPAETPAGVLDEIVETAAGNPLFLEELLRVRAEGRLDAPESVLAMIRARLEGMEPEARRILRAASVYGRSFRSDAAAALVADLDGPTFARWLEVLTEREVLVRAPSGTGTSREYSFCHALAREAAYDMLTDADRELGHRLAAAWLTGHGERDPRVLAEHHEKGGLAASAAPWWARAAQSALEANALGAALELVERGVRAGAQGATLGALRLTEAEARRWSGDLHGAAPCLERALELLPAGDPRWYHAAAEHTLVLQRLGHTEKLQIFARQLLAQSVRDPPSDPLAHALVRGALALLLSGKGALADRLVAAAGDLERARLPLEPATRAQRHVFHALRALYRSDLSTYLKEELLAQRCFEEAGDERRALNESGSVGYAYLELGAWDAAEQALARTLAGAERAELAHVSAAAYHNLGMVYARQGRFAEARAAENRALEVFRTQRDRRLEGAALAYLGHIHLLAGDLERAASTAESALGLVSEVAPPIMPLPLAISAAVELARGRVDLACDISNRAMQLIESGKDVEAGETLARLVHAESLLRAGRTAEARAALSSARARLLQRADRIEDPALRSSFLREVPENARTLQLSES